MAVQSADPNRPRRSVAAKCYGSLVAILLAGYLVHDIWRVNLFVAHRGQPFALSERGLLALAATSKDERLQKLPGRPGLVVCSRNWVVSLDEKANEWDVEWANSEVGVYLKDASTYRVRAIAGSRILLDRVGFYWFDFRKRSEPKPTNVFAACEDRSGAIFEATPGWVRSSTGAAYKVDLTTSSGFCADSSTGLLATLEDGCARVLCNGRLVTLRIPWEFEAIGASVESVAISAADRQIWVAIAHPTGAGSAILAFSPDGDYLGKVATTAHALFSPMGVIGDDLPVTVFATYR